MEQVSNNATSSFSSPSMAKDRISLPSAHANNTGMIHTFDCAICYDSLTKPGPPLDHFTFGKLLINVSQLPYLEREHIYREFQLVDQCFSDGKFDCDKIVTTICGHLFHSGCIREWFFMKRLDRNPKCPFCNRRTYYEECRIVHPIACDPHENENESFQEEEADIPVNLNETEYSDISCTSSSWPTDDESEESEDDEDLEEELDEQNPTTTNVYENTTIEYTNEDFTEESGYAEDLDDSSNSNSDYIPQACDDDLYYPVFIGTDGQSKYGKIDRIMQVVQELAHLLLVLDICAGTCKLYRWKKDKFLAELDTSEEIMDDEQLAELGYEEPVPLGYEFIGLLLTVGVFTFTQEAYFGIYQRRKETRRRTSVPIMILQLLTFIAFASLCLLISRAILFS